MTTLMLLSFATLILLSSTASAAQGSFRYEGDWSSGVEVEKGVNASTASAASTAQQRVFDFFMFVQQWPPSIPNRCTPSGGQPLLEFGIHGLWPEVNTGPSPKKCTPGNKLDMREIGALVPRLKKEWPSWLCKKTNRKFWEHEWSEHGTCSTSELNQFEYFEAAIKLKDETQLLACLRTSGILPNGVEHDLSFVIAKIKKCVGHTPYIQCQGSRLWQVILCVERSGSRLIDCPKFPPSGPCGTKLSLPGQ